MLDEAAYIAKTAVSLWIAPITGTLSFLNSGFDVRDDGYLTRRLKLESNVLWRVTETITNRHIRVVRFFLINPFSNIVHIKNCCPSSLK